MTPTNDLPNSQDHPLITFIVACYNLPADMLRECVASILALPIDNRQRQVIVVDDGSEQCHAEMITGLFPDITFIRQPNQGLSMVRNNALRMARGTYVQFVDGDDCLIPEPYMRCLSKAVEQEADMLTFDFSRERDPRQADNDRSIVTSGTEHMLHNNIKGAAWLYLFKQSILGSLRFTSGIYHEDEEFTPLLLLRTDKLVVSTEKAYFYRQREGSIITDTAKAAKRIRDKMGVAERLKQTAATLPTLQRMALERRVAQLTMDLIYDQLSQNRSIRDLRLLTRQLREKELFPLPAKHYSWKYTAFRATVNTLLR